MKPNGDVRVADVIQINPKKAVNREFGGCFMIVSSVEAWGVKCEAIMPHWLAADAGIDGVHYRAEWPEFAVVGEAKYAHKKVRA